MAPRNGATVGAAVALALVLFISGTAARKTALAAVDNPFATRRLQQTCPGGQSTFCQNIFAKCISITCSGYQITVATTSASGCKSAYSWFGCVKNGGGNSCGSQPSKSDNAASRFTMEASTAKMTAVGIPANPCTPCTPESSCLKESIDGQFTIPGSANNVLTVYNCNAKPQVAGAVPLVFSTTSGSSFPTLNAYLASSVVGQAAAVACYAATDLTWTGPIVNYLYLAHVATPSDNYACLTCDFYNLAKARNKVIHVTPSACVCSTDTAWAIPLKPVMEGLVVGTGEQQLGAPYPAGVYWTARSDATKANAWGGYFRITPIPHTSYVYEFDVCAGCGQNRVSAGFIMARLKFQITSANGQTSVTTFLAPSLTYPTYTPSPTASTTSSVLHMYQSFIAPPTLTPGQMTKSAETTFSLPITYGNSWTVTKVNTGTVKFGSTNANVPATETANGLYVAIHLTVGGQFCY
eukprot:XP_001701136.1 predicted protein [Chlamydomonas reinhardtii]